MEWVYVIILIVCFAFPIRLMMAIPNNNPVLFFLIGSLFGLAICVPAGIYFYETREKSDIRSRLAEGLAKFNEIGAPFSDEEAEKIIDASMNEYESGGKNGVYKEFQRQAFLIIHPSMATNASAESWMSLASVKYEWGKILREKADWVGCVRLIHSKSSADSGHITANKNYGQVVNAGRRVVESHQKNERNFPTVSFEQIFITQLGPLLASKGMTREDFTFLTELDVTSEWSAEVTHRACLLGLTYYEAIVEIGGGEGATIISFDYLQN